MWYVSEFRCATVARRPIRKFRDLKVEESHGSIMSFG
ncbi:hypothetical protein ACUXGO_000807 [Staphylococcus cohnii]